MAMSTPSSRSRFQLHDRIGQVGEQRAFGDLDVEPRPVAAGAGDQVAKFAQESTVAEFEPRTR